MPYFIYNVFTDDSIILYRLIGVGTSVKKSVSLAQQHMDKQDMDAIRHKITLHGHPLTENNRTVNTTLMLSRKEVVDRWTSDRETDDKSHQNNDVFGYVIEKVKENEPIDDQSYQMGWM
jgi:hypothetical protein